MITEKTAIYIAFSELEVFDKYGDAEILANYHCDLGQNGCIIRGDNMEHLSKLITESFIKADEENDE